MGHIRDILSDTNKLLEVAIEAAYKSGFDEGKKVGEREAAAGLKSKLALLFEEDSGLPAREYTVGKDLLTDRDDSQSKETGQRAAPGTVKPVILSVVAMSTNGVATRDVAAATGFKYNSVRGTLWTLQKEGSVARNDDGRWIATPAAKAEAQVSAVDRYNKEVRKSNEVRNNEAPTEDRKALLEIPAGSPPRDGEYE